MDILVICTLGVVFGCLFLHASAGNAYGDHGIVFTAIAAEIDETYVNIISVPTTPKKIDNTTKTEDYPGFNFGFVFRIPLSCAVDYSMNYVYVYDYHLRGLLLLENYNSSAIKDKIKITQQHYGISQEWVKVEVDWISHNVYWIDPLMNWIAMQPGGPINDPSMYKVIVHKNVQFPRGLAIDPIAGYLFWVDYSETSVIERSTLTGDERKKLVYSKMRSPEAILVDPPQQRIYWADIDFVDSVKYDGTDRIHILREDGVYFQDMALFKDVLIITDLSNYLAHEVHYYTRFYDKGTGKELQDKRMVATRETFCGVCMYHGDTQPPQPLLDYCKTASCSEMCVNTRGRASCMCREGSVLQSDGKSCKEQGGQHHRAVVISTGKNLCLLDIRILSDQHDYTPVCFYNGTGNDIIQFFDVNMNRREVYFAIGSTLYKVNIDKGTDGHYSDKRKINDQRFDIIGMSYDYPRERIYFAVGSDPQQIWFIDIYTYTPAKRHLVQSGNLRSLTVVPAQNKVYWLAGNNTLEYVDVADVTTTEVLNVTIGLTNPTRMVHSRKYEMLCVLVNDTSSSLNYLIGLEYNGSFSALLKTELNIVEFTLYKDYVVLVNKKYDGSHEIVSGKWSNGYVLNLIDHGTFSGIGKVYGLKILDGSLQDNIPNPCGRSDNGGCEHTCLIVDDLAKCTCKPGFTLHTDGKQCISSPVYDDFMLVADLTYNEIFQISLNDPKTAIGIRTPTMESADGVMYNYQTDEMMWSSTGQGQIWAITLNGSRQRLIADVYQEFQAVANRMALDPSTGNVYYTGILYSRLSVLNSSFIGVVDKLGEAAIVIWDANKPRDIVLDPAEGLMFWTDAEDGIYRAYMDGSSKKRIIINDIDSPNGLAIDYQLHRVYWTDKSMDSISICYYDGTGQHIFLHVDKGIKLMDIDFMGDYLYFTSMGKQQVTRVSKYNKRKQLFGPVAGIGRLSGIDVYSSVATDNTPFNAECSVNNGGCSHFCFPIPEGSTCGCSWNYGLLPDGKTCETDTTSAPEPAPDTSILVTAIIIVVGVLLVIITVIGVVVILIRMKSVSVKMPFQFHWQAGRDNDTVRLGSKEAQPATSVGYSTMT